MNPLERRKDARIGLSIPVRVQGHDAEGPAWEEMTTSEDASYGGVRFPLRHPVVAGHVLMLSLPFPKNLRRYAVGEPFYHVYSLVRAVLPAWPATRVGVKFLGKTPPKGYEANPGGRYLLPNDPRPAPASTERRHFKRLDVYLNLKLKRTGGATGEEEQTVTENLGRGGARVTTGMGVDKGELLVVEDPGGAFSTRAEIRNVFIGKDGVPRLNLRFVAGEATERLVAAAGIANLGG